MIGKIAIATIFYILLVVYLTLDYSETDHYVLLITISSAVFAGFVFYQIYKKYLVGIGPQMNTIMYSDARTDLTQLTKISKRPFIFGLERRFINDEDFYFDARYFYVANRQDQVAKFDLNSITELKRTPISLNKSSIWQVTIKEVNKSDFVFKFVHNHTLWNRGFYAFYDKLKMMHPGVVKSKWSLWRM